MPIREVAIRTVGDLSREVRALAPIEQKWLFRGQTDACWNLAPSVHRGYTAQQERYLTNEFRVRARSRHYSCPSSDDYPGWLALMQHYGLPTRLLDWTYSPLTAAFFSVHPDYVPRLQGPGRDACIWALDGRKLNESQGFEPLIFPLDASSYEPLIVPAFKNRDELNSVGVAMAIEHDPRIQLQQGAFTIHSSRTPINRIEGADEWLRRWIVRNADIPAFFEELTTLGIRKFTLFPDLSALTSELKSIHRPGKPCP
ncbi:MAG TPA: FRG domain-containing protein [Noviherbaspirillum sp.]|uniref:FRG domain-containing protein n=1 Tax=Noviherbaspirillum sp. TaxID=1926288 RepID=UPI002B48A162|nr:FRG domain-containing protein [Noviherbaspirillum sp.]HJV86236.1 FRG domain-containing protein [Noviherbaspirillum sp.]